MRINNNVGLQSLVIISLSSCMFHVNASDSVASYEKSLEENTIPASKVQADNINLANYDINQLSIELKKRGWTINKANDGSLVLKPNLPEEKIIQKESGRTDHWQQIKQKFNQAGWAVKRDSDGSLHLSLQQTQVSSSSQQEVTKSQKQATKAKSIFKPKNTNNISFQEMKKQLEEKGWGVTNNVDGSLLLYPPDQSLPSFSKNCYGSPTTIAIELPVNSWKKAYDVVQQWLDDHSIKNAIVGKIRKVINVYIVSVVTRQSPHTLLHQVAIKNSDGAVISLD